MATTLANISFKDSSSWNSLLNLTYPIGSVYMSYTSTSPATRFGGTWTAITGRFPYFNAGTTTGGSNSQTVDFSHTHAMRTAFDDRYVTANGLKYGLGDSINESIVATHDSSWEDVEIGPVLTILGTKKTLGNKTINTLPAYQTLYAWRRTA